MALIKKKKVEPINYTSAIGAKIQQRRLQILVHSYLYYDCDENLISDKDWDKWSKELVKLQNNNPDIADKVIFAKDFKGFDGTTGFNLPYKDDMVVKIAKRLLRSEKGVQ